MQIFLFIIPFAFGLFYEFTSYFAQIFLLVILGLILKRRKKLRFYFNISSILIIIIVLGYLMTCFYAKDSGMAVLGFLKFSTLATFALIVMQYKKEQINKIIGVIPISGIAIIIVSILFKILPFLPDNYFLSNGRMMGTFEYSNTFAVFLLIGIITMLNSNNKNIIKVITTIILLMGIYATGSRIVLALTILNFIIFAIKLKQIRKNVIGVFVGSLAIVIIYFALTNNFGVINRYLTMPFESSTFLGRILYYKDAIPLVLQNPFGLGYMGYYYMQPTIQTGLYSTVYVHNDILQIMLDVGILPGILFIIAIIKNLVNKEKFDVKKQIILTIILHILFDFDLQFLSIFFILIMMITQNKGKRFIVNIKMKLYNVCVIILSILYMYFGICTFLHYINKSDLAIKMYPYYTDANIKIMYDEADNNIKYANEIANKVLETNKNVPLAYKIKALYYLEKSQWKLMISSKQKSIKLCKYEISNYDEYVLMLSRAMTYYINNDNMKDAEECIKLVLQVPSQIDEVQNSTSEISYKIKDVPKFELSAQTQKYIKKLKGE